MKIILMLLATASLAWGQDESPDSGGWQYHYWTAEDVLRYAPEHTDIVGKTWWMKHIDGDDVSNIEDVYDYPCHVWLTVRTWTNWNIAVISTSNDLMGEWYGFDYLTVPAGYHDPYSVDFWSWSDAPDPQGDVFFVRCVGADVLDMTTFHDGKWESITFREW